MGKCVSRQTTTTTTTCRSSLSGNGGSSLAACRAAHHQSVLTIALSQPDLAQAHKIWQQLTASNEYIEAATASSAAVAAQEVTTLALAEPPFYYHISRNKALEEEQARHQQQAEAEQVQAEAEEQAEAVQLQALRPPQHAEWEAAAPPSPPPAAAALLHIDAVYNHLDAPANARHVIAAALTASNSNNDNNCDSNYATCQELLLLVQALEEYQVKNITSTFTANGDCQLRANDSDSSVAAQQEEEAEEQKEQEKEQQEAEQQHGEQQQQPHEGQSESKKHNGNGKASRRHNGNHMQANPGQDSTLATQSGTETGTLQTKGTAMSFGFRKKLNGTPKKLKKLLHEATKDDNGNATVVTATPTAAPVQFEKVGAAAQKTNPTGRQGAAGKRFGYRGAQVPRPASAGLAGEDNNGNGNGNGNGTASAGNSNSGSSNSNNNNNNGNTNVLVSNLKRRSKSAHAGRASDGGEPKIAQPKTLTFNLNQNTTIEYQRRQFFGEITDESMAMTGTAGAAGGNGRQMAPPPPRYNYNNLANMHANVIVRPTPRAAPASFAKFTLQTVSLPRPEYPVAISLNATTPTTPSSSSVQSPVPATHSTGARAKEIPVKHPLTSIHAQPTCSTGHSHRQLDQKSVKQLTNNSTRRGFSGSREISADSGIASMDAAVDSAGSSSSGGGGGGGGGSSKSRSRSRPRNLQMVMSGRHTFEVRDMDDPPSSESNSFVETLALPKLPTDNSQTTPLPLVGLVRSNTVLSRESYERRQAGQEQGTTATAAAAAVQGATPETPPKPKPSGSDDSESVDEEKLYLDSSTSEKSAKQSLQSSSMSWRCQAGESLAARDCSSLTNSSNETQQQQRNEREEQEEDMSLDDMSLINTELDVPFSSISSLTEPEHLLKLRVADNREEEKESLLRPRSFNNALNGSKFAELALANSGCLLLEDEPSPTDSLVSSTEDSVEQAEGKLQKHKLNAELQQQQLEQEILDIDDISPVLEELELDPIIEGSRSRSPLSPGTPTHASHSLSLGSDCGNLIDDEIADQPGLLCNSEAQELATDTPTLMETHTGTGTGGGGGGAAAGSGSLRSLKSQSKARTALQQAIELSLRTPAAVRRAVLESAESLDTLSPCESICSDDLMMDFDLNSSIDSMSQRSRSGSDLHKLGTTNELEMDVEQAETEAELLSQLECKGSDVMKELNSLLRVRMQRSVPSPRERISAKLPARATRLLNRSRLQDQQHQLQTGNDSDNSLRSTHSGASAGRKRSSTAASNASSTSSLQRRQQHQQQQLSATASGSRRATGHGAGNAELHSSSDDLMLYDKSFRNAMIQDVLQFKKQLLRLRRILQETETLNPFENDNVQLFAACGLDSKQLNDIDLASLTSSTTEDPLQELSDLRRQVVYLQGQVDDRDRTIRLQRDLIEQLEAERRQAGGGSGGDVANKELISMATQTERTRPLAIGAEGLSRSKPEYTSYTTHFPTLHLHCNDSTLAATTIIRHQQQEPCNGHSSNTNNNNNNSCRALSQTRRHTIISTTLTNYNQQLAAAAYPRRASIAWDGAELSTATSPASVAAATTTAHKPVRITLIGEPLPLPNTENNRKTSPAQHKHKQSQQAPQQNGIKPTRFLNGSCNGSSAQGTHPYQPLYNSNKMTNPTVTIV